MIQRLARRLAALGEGVMGAVRHRRIMRRVAADAREIVARVATDGHRRGLFIDCGSNVGQGYDFFRRYFPLDRFDFVLVEPNPQCLPRLRRLADADAQGRIKIIPAAASTTEGIATFYGARDQRGETSLGGSILSEHNSRYYDLSEQSAIEVPTFSLAEFIRSKAPSYSAVVVKIDIEGAEYDVLEDLVRRDVERSVDAMYVEFHSQYMREPQRSAYRVREERIARSLRGAGIRFSLWD